MLSFLLALTMIVVAQMIMERHDVPMLDQVIVGLLFMFAMFIHVVS